MRYIKLFENKYNSWQDVIEEIESYIIPDKEEFDNIFLDWKEFIEGKSYSIGNLSMPKFTFHKINHLDLVKKHSQNVFNGGLSRGSGVNNSMGLTIHRVLSTFVSTKKIKPYEFDINQFTKFASTHGIGGWETHGYEIVIDWTIFTNFASNWGHPNRSEEFLEVESLVQEVVERMEQFFGLKYSLFVRYPHDVAIFTIYFYK